MPSDGVTPFLLSTAFLSSLCLSVTADNLSMVSVTPASLDTAKILATPILNLPKGISIRPYRTTDAASIAYHANNRAIWLNMTDLFPSPYTLENAHSWIAMQLDPAKTWHSTLAPSANASAQPIAKIPSNYVLALQDTAIGGIGLKFGSDVERRTLELGYWLGQEHWGKGVTTVAAKAFLDWTLNTFPWIVRVSANIFHWNEASVRVAEKCGMERESVMRAAVYKDGKVGDLVCYVRIREGLEY